MISTLFGSVYKMETFVYFRSYTRHMLLLMKR